MNIMAPDENYMNIFQCSFGTYITWGIIKSICLCFMLNNIHPTSTKPYRHIYMYIYVYIHVLQFLCYTMKRFPCIYETDIQIITFSMYYFRRITLRNRKGLYLKLGSAPVAFSVKISIHFG